MMFLCGLWEEAAMDPGLQQLAAKPGLWREQIPAHCIPAGTLREVNASPKKQGTKNLWVGTNLNIFTELV